jgi:hypothetical protein
VTLRKDRAHGPVAGSSIGGGVCVAAPGLGQTGAGRISGSAATAGGGRASVLDGVVAATLGGIDRAAGEADAASARTPRGREAEPDAGAVAEAPAPARRTSHSPATTKAKAAAITSTIAATPRWRTAVIEAAAISNPAWIRKRGPLRVNTLLF